MLYLAESLFDGVHVWRVGGQEHEIRPPPLDELADLLGPVPPEPIEHHHLPLAKRGCQEVLHISLEGQGVRGAPSTVIDSPIPSSRVIAAIRVWFLPLFCAEPCRRPSCPSAPSLSGASWRC